MAITVATGKSPNVVRLMAGGNDQLQRDCRIRGVSRGKEGFMATNSSIATVAYVADTHVIPSSHIVDNFQNKLASKMGYYLAAVTFILSLSTMPGECLVNMVIMGNMVNEKHRTYKHLYI